MKRSIAVVVVAFIVLLNVAAAAEKSAVGTWKLDLKKSSFGTLSVPKFEQLVITTDAPNELKWNIKGVGPDGKSYMTSYTGPIDGKDHPMMNSQGGGTVAYTRMAEGMTWVVKSKEGAVIETAASQLSPDGKTLTIDGVSETPKGKVKFIAVYDRAQ